jgi:hypothetical protein
LSRVSFGVRLVVGICGHLLWHEDIDAMDNIYEIDYFQSEVTKEENKLKALVKRLPECNCMTEAFETNTAVKCYCPACGVVSENTRSFMAHLLQRSNNNRNKKYVEQDNSHTLVKNYITSLYPQYNRG